MLNEIIGCLMKATLFYFENSTKHCGTKIAYIYEKGKALLEII